MKRSTHRALTMLAIFTICGGAGVVCAHLLKRPADYSPPARHLDYAAVVDPCGEVRPPDAAPEETRFDPHPPMLYWAATANYDPPEEGQTTWLRLDATWDVDNTGCVVSLAFYERRRDPVLEPKISVRVGTHTDVRTPTSVQETFQEGIRVVRAELHCDVFVETIRGEGDVEVGLQGHPVGAAQGKVVLSPESARGFRGFLDRYYSLRCERMGGSRE